MTVSVEHIYKKYKIGTRRGDRLRDYFFKQKSEEFWALNDISFKVEQGEKIGLIGKNGAGKSTLLKVLNGITTPTKGSIQVKGRLVSLIEVGSGFHPELSGRENIYLYGAILGMSRKEIRGKLDEMVAFSGVEEFLDLPVKRFSSGMYARLGFSIAIHANPEILVIDEVFSVGDLSFQQKCIERLQALGMNGVTLLFVGHHLEQLVSLCTRGLLLDRGSLLYDGPVKTCATLYKDLT